MPDTVANSGGRIRNYGLKTYRAKQIFSAEDGRLLPSDEENGHWILAGHGAQIKLE